MADTPTIECACGCGGTLTPTDGRGRPRKFLPSHWSRVQPTQRTTLLCDHCRAPIHRAPWELRRGQKNNFCDAKCAGQWIAATGAKRGERNGHYHSITVPCGTCSAPVTKAFSLVMRRNRRVYCPTCIPPRDGSGRVDWSAYPPEFSPALRRKIRQRDGYTCQWCGKSREENRAAPQVHHIDDDPNNNDPLNLICLCRSCHGQTQFGREVWQERLRKKMADRFP